MVIPTWPSSSELLAPLVPWFVEQGRSLPWRASDLGQAHPDPYAVLVSEFMLQQTQVRTVIPYFQRWMRRFPDLESLTQASEDEVHKEWEGLGYYRRARQLQAASRIIVEHGWPSDEKGLRQLPGMGPYTASALASIAFLQPEPALDGNAFRVLARLLLIEEDMRPLAQELRAWLRPALEVHGPSRLTQALMEVGATVCQARPSCKSCPLAESCAARSRSMVDRIPVKVPRKAPREMDIVIVAAESNGKWLLRPPRRAGLLAGLWQWPSVDLSTSPAMERAAEDASRYGCEEWRAWPCWIQTYSHRRERVFPVALHLDHPKSSTPEWVWVEAGKLQGLPMGKRDQRLRDLLASPSGESALSIPLAPILHALCPDGAIQAP